MKQALFLCVIISYFLSSCVKCTTCRNECYLCGGSSEPSCSTDAASKAAWESIKANLKNTAGCTEVTATKEQQICDKNLDDLKYLYEKDNFYCD